MAARKRRVIHPGLMQRLRSEEDPAQENDDKAHRPGDPGWEASIEWRHTRAFQTEKESVVDAPGYETPARTVPEAAQDEHDREIPARAPHASPVAAERDVQVV